MNRIARQALARLEHSRKALEAAGRDVCKCRPMLNEEMASHLFNFGWCRDTRPWVPVCPVCNKPQRHGWTLNLAGGDDWKESADVELDELEAEVEEELQEVKPPPAIHTNGHHHVEPARRDDEDDDKGRADDDLWVL